MTVKELITALMQMPPNAVPVLYSESCCQCMRPVTLVEENDEDGSVVMSG